MLARLIDNNGLVQYYARRMSFVRRLRTFVSSGYINVDDIRADEENSGDYPVLEMRSRQLRILSYIYDSSKTIFYGTSSPVTTTRPPSAWPNWL